MTPPPNTWRAPLLELRAALFRLHKTLLDAERLSYAIEHGPIKNNGDYLQLLIHNERFTWLQPYTKLVVNIDETEESKEPVSAEAVEALWERAKGLTAESTMHDSLAKLLTNSAEVQANVAEVVRLQSKRF